MQNEHQAKGNKNEKVNIDPFFSVFLRKSFGCEECKFYQDFHLALDLGNPRFSWSECIHRENKEKPTLHHYTSDGPSDSFPTHFPLEIRIEHLISR